MINININPELEKGFKNFTVDKKNIPIQFRRYTGKETTYLEYYTWSTKAEEFANDLPVNWGIYGTIDLYSKNNYKNILNEVLDKLIEIGFTVTDVGQDDYEDDTQYYHVPINFYKEGGN